MNKILFRSLLYVLSLAAVFIMFFLIFLYDICCSNMTSIYVYEFIGLIISVLGILSSILIFVYFRFKTNHSTNLARRKPKIEKINYEPVGFLTTLIVPALMYDINSPKDLFVIFFLILITGIVYIKTGMVYKNITLILFNFSIYKVIDDTDYWHEGDILLSFGDIPHSDEFIISATLDSDVYFVRRTRDEYS